MATLEKMAYAMTTDWWTRNLAQLHRHCCKRKANHILKCLQQRLVAFWSSFGLNHILNNVDCTQARSECTIRVSEKITGTAEHIVNLVCKLTRKSGGG